MVDKCRRCGRSLANAKSITNGMGATCYKKSQQDTCKEDKNVKVVKNELAGRIWKRVSKVCIHCGANLSDELLSYPHQNGIEIEGEKQWVFAECPSCKAQISIYKLQEARA